MHTLSEIAALAEEYERQLPAVPPLPAAPEGAGLARWIDHTLLKPEATPEQIKRLCEEARQHQFATVCVNPAYITLARGLLREAGVGVCSVVAFPLGATLPTYKVYEARSAVEAGASEVDMVINIGALKGGAYALILNEISDVVAGVHELNAVVKVIIETALLTQKEKIMACLLSKTAGADFVKTSTGFASGGATTADVSLMRRVVGAEMGVKASGGIRSLADARAMIGAGANRLGASASVAIMQALAEEKA